MEPLWQSLKDAGLVAGERPLPGVVVAPWFVRAMLGVSGWIGALFLLTFVGMGLSFVMESTVASFGFGLAACVTAGALFRFYPDKDFVNQFGLAVSLSGQVLLLFALNKGFGGHMSAVAMSMSLFQAVLFFFIPNYVHRVWTAWTSASCLIAVLVDWHVQVYAPGLLSVLCAWVWLNEFQHPRHGVTLRAGGYGLILALMCAMAIIASTSGTWFRFDGTARSPSSIYHVWIGASLGGAALLWTVWRLLGRETVAPTSREGKYVLGVAGIFALASMKAPGLAPATLILLLGYGNGNRVLSGMGVVTLLGYLSFYYYSLEATLLFKSAVMIATGLSLLAIRVMLQTWWPARQKQDARYA